MILLLTPLTWCYFFSESSERAVNFVLEYKWWFIKELKQRCLSCFPERKLTFAAVWYALLNLFRLATNFTRSIFCPSAFRYPSKGNAKFIQSWAHRQATPTSFFPLGLCCFPCWLSINFTTCYSHRQVDLSIHLKLLRKICSFFSPVRAVPIQEHDHYWTGNSYQFS